MGEKIRRAMGISLDIAIAGAGPAGLVAALYLKRAGHRVTIFKRFDAPKPVGSGLILQPTVTAPADLGLLDDILVPAQPHRPPAWRRCENRRSVLDVRYDAQRGGRFGLAVTGRPCSACFSAPSGARRSPSKPASNSRRWKTASDNADLRQRATDKAAGVSGAVADADAVLPVGFDRDAVCPRQAGGVSGENPASAKHPCLDGGWNRGRSLRRIGINEARWPPRCGG